MGGVKMIRKVDVVLIPWCKALAWGYADYRDDSHHSKGGRRWCRSELARTGQYQLNQQRQQREN
jgi:hypothetical protein